METKDPTKKTPSKKKKTSEERPIYEKNKFIFKQSGFKLKGNLLRWIENRCKEKNKQDVLEHNPDQDYSTKSGQQTATQDSQHPTADRQNQTGNNRQLTADSYARQPKAGRK